MYDPPPSLSSPPSNAAEWFSILYHFRYSLDTRQNLLKGANEVILLDHILRAFRSEKDDIIRVNLLIFLQENVGFFLEDDPKRLEKVFTVLNGLLHSSTEASASTPATPHYLKSQILITLTTIFIEQSIIKTQPRVFQSFLELLLDTMAKVNSVADRALRSESCHCLIELETHYPLLLSSTIGHLYVFSQQENSHVVQDYIILLQLALRHLIQASVEDSFVSTQINNNNTPTSSPFSSPPAASRSHRSFSRLTPPSGLVSPIVSTPLLSTETPLTPFNIPTITKFTPMPLYTHSFVARIQDTLSKDVLKCISFIVDQTPQLNQYGLLSTIPHSIPLVNLASIPSNIFHHPNLFRMVYSNNPLFFHLVVYLLRVFPEIFTPQEIQLIVSKLLHFTKDLSISMERRILTMDWISSLTQINLTLASTTPPVSIPSLTLNSPNLASVERPKDTTITPAVPFLHPHYREFYPMVFDSPSLKMSKFIVLLKCFSSTHPPPAFILGVLLCFDEFRYYGPTGPPVQMVFEFIRTLLSNFSSTLLTPTHNFLLSVFVHYPQFVSNIIYLIDALAKEGEVSLFLLRNFEKVLVTFEPSKLSGYLPMVERIVMEKSINPRPLVISLYSLIRGTSFCQEGDWNLGSNLLQICRTILLNLQHSDTTLDNAHPFFHQVFKPLSLLLGFLAKFHADIEIRDRAHFFHLLLTHVPPSKTASILSEQIDPKEVVVDDSVGLVSPYIEKQKPVKSTPRFLVLECTKPAFGENQLIITKRESNNENSEETNNNNNSFLKNSNSSNNLLPNPSSIFDVYLYYINSDPNFNPSIPIPYTLHYSEPPPPGFFPPKIYALVVQFNSNSTPYYHPLTPIRIPYLCRYSEKDHGSNSNIDLNSFPFGYPLILYFRPILPLPVVFPIRTIFNDSEGKTCKGEIDPISISFTDLLMPLPIPPQVISEGSSDNENHDNNSVTKDEFLDLMFNKLWTWVISEEKKGDLGGAKSVKYLEAQDEVIFAMLSGPLSSYVVTKKQANVDTLTLESNASEAFQESRVLFYLPPHFHLLLKFKVFKKHAVVKVRTDLWRVLVQVDNFLAYLLDSQLKKGI
eukprot:TRINITY_DN1972_c0_g1_i1.p1 TRINITY_DN1972_c0_g1~~TRINITY_DN1972_c0_g1_i1.p1  ORF type:complete len:1085 (-),score=211.49 TRINITY_DN1972_c0_g1_i1:53-3307(-)